MDSWADWCADVNTNPDVEFYQPEITQHGGTRPFRPTPVVIARPATVVERPGPDGDFLAGFATGLALGIPIWFGLVMIAIAVAGR